MLCWPLAVQAQQVLQAQVSLARPEKIKSHFDQILHQSHSQSQPIKSRNPDGGQPIAQKMNLEELLEEGRGNGKNELVSLNDNRLRMVMMLNLH